MKDSEWVIHFLNRLDRYSEDLRIAAVRAREAAVSTKRAGWFDPDSGERAIAPELRKTLEDSLTARKMVRMLEDLTCLLERTNKSLEEGEE